MLGEIDGAGLGQRLHALRHPDRVSERGGIDAQVLTDSAHHDFARIEPDANVEVHPVGATKLVRIRANGAGHLPGRMARAASVVLLRERSSEQRHDAVAGELVDGAPEAPNLTDEDVHEAVDDLRPRLDVELLLKLHRALDVGKQHGQLLTLALGLVAHPTRGVAPGSGAVRGRVRR